MAGIPGSSGGGAKAGPQVGTLDGDGYRVDDLEGEGGRKLVKDVVQLRSVAMEGICERRPVIAPGVADNRRPAAAAPTSGWLMSGSQAAAPHSASHRQNPKWEKPISPVSPRHGVILLYRPRTIQTVCVHSNLSFRRVKTFVDVHSTPTCYFRHQQLSIPRYRYYTPVRVRLSQDSSSQD